MQKMQIRKEWKRPINELIENFPSVYQFCNGDLHKLVLLLWKRLYPYEYMDNWEKCNETALAPKEVFFIVI